MQRGGATGGSGEQAISSGSATLRPVNPLVVAAHELKTPLVLMRQLSLELLDSSADADLPIEDSRVIAQKIRLTAERSLRLVDGLTRAARLEDGLFKLEPIYIDSVLHDIVTEISPLASALNQKIVIHKARQSSPVIANRDLLRALILNIIDNSLQYNNSGQAVEISMRLSRPRDHVTAPQASVIEVRDHGASLSLHEFRGLRDNLGRRQPLSDRPLSSGLGLAIAEAFAQKMNGRLDIARHRQNGLTFSVTLPLSRQLSLWDAL